MNIWSTEIKDIERIYNSLQGSLPNLEKELGRLIATDDENMLLVYSRRCLEVIITDICEIELKRHRGTEPLQRIIDKLNKEEIVPHNIVVSMQNVNSMSTFGAHPKEFELKQVKPVLSNLDTIINWYIKYRDIKVEGIELKNDKKQKIISGERKKSKRKEVVIASTLILVVLVFSALVYFDFITLKKQHKNGNIDSIVVLPFDNFTGIDSMEFYVSGMHASVIGAISRISSLRVIGKTSANTYKNTNLTIPEIASELNVDAVIEAEVLCSDDSICIQFDLVSIYPEEKQAWVGTYKEDKRQIKNLYNQITKQIAEEVKVKLTPEEEEIFSKSETVNKEAYDAYLKGLFYWDRLSKDALETALEYFNRAIDIDPTMASAYAGRAGVWVGLMQMGFESPAAGIPKIYENISKALDLDPNYPESNYWNALISMAAEWNWEKSENAFLKALEKDPNNAYYNVYYSHLLSELKRPEEAESRARRGYELDPLNPLIQSLYGVILWHNGNFELAASMGEKTMLIMPDSPLAARLLFGTYFELGEYEKSLKSLKKMLPFNENEIERVQKVFDESGYFNSIKEILNIIDEKQDIYISPFWIAIYHLVLNENDKALDWFEKGYQLHDPDMPYMNAGTGITLTNKIRNEPRFIAIVNKMNLPLN